MTLPKIDVPLYEILLPLSKKRIKYRPFTVKEQRNLLMAMEADESEIIQQNIADILNNCTITEGIEIDQLPIIDVEYYFINLRAKSVGEIVDVRYRCNNKLKDDEICNNIMETKIDLTKVQVENKKEINPEIKLTDKFIVKLKYPQFSFIREAFKFDDVNQLTFNIIAQSIEYVYDGEQFYYASEVELSEMIDFIENLSQEQFQKIEDFFNNLPNLSQKINLTCGKCGFKHDINVQGLENFFG